MIWIYLTFLASVAVRASALSCYSCNYYGFDGENTNYQSSCYHISGSTPVDSCSITYPDYYCRTQLSVRDGIVTQIRRDCARGSSDNDQSTNWMPTANKCHSNLYSTSSSDLERSECYYHCNDTDNCNTVTVSTLKTCGTDCGRGARRGYCDYISGNCACRSGWSGLDCSNAVVVAPIHRRKCVQCFSETDSGCTTKIDGSHCPSDEQYCSSTQTSIFKQNEVVRTILIRGCTSSHIAVDECKFTSIYSDSGIRDRGYNEFTCYSTCDTDNCNTNTPDGVLNGSEKPLLKCEQCTSAGSCSPSPTFCPSESTHCKSTVTYVISDKVDARYRVDTPSSYKILSTVRECATSPVTTGCTETKIGQLSFKNVTCQETCQDDGCNTGWPARPKCIRCSGSTCLTSPPQASDCNYPYEQYCTIRDHGLQEGTRETLDGYPRVTYRGCSYVDIGTGCNKTILRDRSIQTCNYTCSTDGCNVGSGTSSVDPKINMAAALVLLALCIQWNIISS